MMTYSLRIVPGKGAIRDAQRLRAEVFGVTTANGLDHDALDLAAEHILLSTQREGVIATCRLLTQELLASANLPQGEFYSKGEFELQDLPPEVLCAGVELGRLAIVKHHRNGPAFLSIWSAIGKYVYNAHKQYLFGCASIPGLDEQAARRLLQTLRASGAIHSSFKVGVLDALRCHDAALTSGRSLPVPPLLRLYLAAGAHICSEPAVDRAFGVCDVLTVLDTSAMKASYRKRFFSGKT
jgi:putative hemolysin